jgi:hypothetical protein
MEEALAQIGSTILLACTAPRHIRTSGDIVYLVQERFPITDLRSPRHAFPLPAL